MLFPQMRTELRVHGVKVRSESNQSLQQVGAWVAQCPQHCRVAIFTTWFEFGCDFRAGLYVLVKVVIVVQRCMPPWVWLLHVQDW